MRRAASLILLLLVYMLIAFPFSERLKQRPVVVKLGYLPEAEVLKIVAPDFSPLLAQYAVIKVLLYYGTLYEEQPEQVIIPPEAFNMFKTIERAIKLDPYNMDAYYFAQSAFNWELGRARDVNQLLKYGMKYRVWDWQLPFYAGFNAAYFLEDYPAAAQFMARASDLSGQPLFSRLAARYLSKSGQTEAAIVYLKTMMENCEDEAIRASYQLRLRSLLEVQRVEQALARYRVDHGTFPANIYAMVKKGYLESAPIDPMGGEFYLASEGAVKIARRQRLH